MKAFPTYGNYIENINTELRFKVILITSINHLQHVPACSFANHICLNHLWYLSNHTFNTYKISNNNPVVANYISHSEYGELRYGNRIVASFFVNEIQAIISRDYILLLQTIDMPSTM